MLALTAMLATAVVLAVAGYLMFTVRRATR